MNPSPHFNRIGLLFLLALLAALALWAGAATATPPPTAVDQILLTPYAGGFSAPVDVANAGDGRLFVVEQAGTIRIIDAGGAVLPAPFLTIPPSEINSTGSEQGLLGLAFHPDYANNGYFYVNYTDENGDTHISRFSRDPADPDQADFGSELILLEVAQPFENHNAGDLAFGPDGYLYVPLGDGGAGNDPGNRALDETVLLGKILRLDVDGAGDPSDCGPGGGAAGGYTVPSDNPLADGPGGACDEIWALGLRNPWRISFDQTTGDLWIGDVGQGRIEEIDFQPAASSGGQNYGWRCYEGSQPSEVFTQTVCTDTYTFPVFDYLHYENGQFLGCAVTGGYVYRGSSYPTLNGTYLFADFCSSNYWTIRDDGLGGWEVDFLGQLVNDGPSSFGEDADGELYVAGYSGIIYRVEVTEQHVYLPAVFVP